MEAFDIQIIIHLPFISRLSAVTFDSLEDRESIVANGPCFRDNTGFFLEPWSPYFDPSVSLITLDLVWFRLLNLPLHMWNSASLTTISDALGKFYCICLNTSDFLKTTYARICMQMEFNKGLLT
jgi:hypothetical protein